MSIEQIVLISIIQGLTEFLPVSSSGHLVILPILTGWTDQGLITDIMVHVGSLFAVLVYFWRDVVTLTYGKLDFFLMRRTSNSRLFFSLVLATTPAVLVAGVMAYLGLLTFFRSIEVVAWNSVIFSLLLYVADKFGSHSKKMEDMTPRPAFFVGVAQIFALMPGVSRSGVTISAARAFGFERTEAARFSFLMSIPIITLVGLFSGFDAWRQGTPIPSEALWAAFGSFFSALAAIWLLMKIVSKISFAVFVVYRLLLAAILFAIAYGGLFG